MSNESWLNPDLLLRLLSSIVPVFFPRCSWSAVAAGDAPSAARFARNYVGRKKKDRLSTYKKRYYDLRSRSTHTPETCSGLRTSSLVRRGLRLAQSRICSQPDHNYCKKSLLFLLTLVTLLLELL